MQPFTYATSASLSVSTSSQSLVLPGAGENVRLSTPAGTSDCFIVFGTSSDSSNTTTGVHFPAGCVEVVTVAKGVTHLHAICATGSTTLYAVRSNGQ